MKKITYSLLLAFMATSLFGQTPFSRIYDIDENALRNGLNGLVYLDEQLYTNSTLFCQSDTTTNIYNHCSAMVKYDMQGEVVEKIVMDTFISGLNNGIDVFNNEIILTGHNNEPFIGRKSRMIIYDEDLKEIDYHVFEGDMDETINNSGFWPQESVSFVVGINNNNYSPGAAEAQIYKLDNNLDVVWERSYTAGDLKLECNDIQATPDDNYAFILWYEGQAGAGGGPSGYQITKINQSGDTLKTYSFEDTGHQNNRLLVASDGSYYFGSRRNPLNYFETSNGRINKLNADMSALEWTLQLPNDPLTDGRIFILEDYLEAKNGDIVACGRVWDNSDSEIPGPDKNSTYNGFIVRLTPAGEVLWLRVYRNPQNLLDQSIYGKFRHSKLEKIIELDSGHFVAGGEVYYNDAQLIEIDESKNEIFHIWLLLVDENGCLNENDCNEITYLTKTNDLIKDHNDLLIYPNPVNDNLYLNKTVFNSNYKIFDVQGRQVQLGTLQQQINVSLLNPGFYFIKISNNKNHFITLKFIKS